MVSIRTRKYTLFSKRTSSIEEAISVRNKFLIDRYGNLDVLKRKNVPYQNRKNEFKLADDGTFYFMKCSNGTIFKIDVEDFEKVFQYTWGTNGDGYIENPKAGKLHRFILSYIGNKEIDHKNRDKTDNRKSNLRITNKSINMQNRGKQKNKKSSNYKGVFTCKKNGTYFCEITKDGKLYRKRGLKTEEDAAIEYNKLAVE